MSRQSPTANLFVTRCCLFVFAASLAFLPAAAHALPGEMAAVQRHCGKPAAENSTTSQVTGREQHDLIYNDLILHFEPEEAGWSFTTAWHGHFPMTREELERRLPCFRDALQEVASKPLPVIDPTIASQTTAPDTINQTTFGIPHFWLIVALVFITLLVVLLPRRRKSEEAVVVQDVRRSRKPLVRGRFARRGPRPPLE